MPPISTTALLEGLQKLHRWPTQGDILHLCYHSIGPAEAAAFVIVGIIFLLFGVQIYKMLVMLNAALAGALIGGYIGDKAGNAPVGAAVGGFIAAAVSWPLMKHAVALMGAAVGAFVGVAVWRLAGLNAQTYWAGALCGAVIFGMTSYAIFRGCVIAFTSLQGAAMIVVGVLSLAYKYPDFAPKITSGLSSRNYILPIAVFIPALFGLIYQQTPSAKAQPAKK